MPKSLVSVEAVLPQQVPLIALVMAFLMTPG